MARKYFIWLAGIMLGLIFIMFVHNQPVNAGWTVFCVLLTGCLLLSIWKEAKHSRHGWIMIICGLGVALSHAIYVQDHLTSLNLIVAPLVTIYGCRVLYFGDARLEGHVKEYIKDRGRMFLSVKSVYRYIKSFFAGSLSIRPIPKIKNNTISGIILSILVLMILIPVLSSVDPIFAQTFNNIVESIVTSLFRIGEFFNGLRGLDEIIVFVIVTTIVLSLMLFFSSAAGEKVSKAMTWSMEPSIYSIMSRSIAVIYVLFAFIQIKYLLLGGELPPDITYSQYAVSGFRQLIGISFVNIALMLCAPHYRRNQSKKLYMVLLRIVFLSSMVIRRSALFRLNLYIEVYGLTFMRILPLSFIIYLGYGLIVSFIGIFHHNTNRSNMLAYGLVIWYAAFQLIGVDRIIANYNIKRYVTEQTDIIDVNYLTQHLSADQMDAEYNLDDLSKYLSQSNATTGEFSSDINTSELQAVTQIEEYKKNFVK